MDCTIYVAKTKALIRCAFVTAYDFVYAKSSNGDVKKSEIMLNHRSTAHPHRQNSTFIVHCLDSTIFLHT